MLYTKIMVPVDLVHAESLDKALKTAGDLAKLYDASVTYVGVTSSAPGSVAHSAEEFETRFQQFADQRSRAHGVEVAAKVFVSHDPAVELDHLLFKAIDETGADLVVMASHMPGLAEHLFASNAGYIASHAKISVMVIR